MFLSQTPFGILKHFTSHRPLFKRHYLFDLKKIIFGGGVVSEELLDKVRDQFSKLFNNYLSVGDLKHYITMPTVEDNGSATVGNFALALKQYYKENIVKI